MYDLCPIKLRTLEKKISRIQFIPKLQSFFLNFIPKSFFLHNSLLTFLLYISALVCLIKRKYDTQLSNSNSNSISLLISKRNFDNVIMVHKIKDKTCTLKHITWFHITHYHSFSFTDKNSKFLVHVSQWNILINIQFFKKVS